MIDNNTGLLRVCVQCGATKTHIVKDKGELYERWHKTDSGYICYNCYQSNWYNKTGKNKIYHTQHRFRQFKFLGKVIYLSWKIKKGICICCKQIKRTTMHHLFYIPCMPWACTLELCKSCHNKTHWSLDTFWRNKYGHGRRNKHFSILDYSDPTNICLSKILTDS